VLHNGALVVDGGRVIHCAPLDKEAARRAILVGRRHGANAVLHCGPNGEGRLVIEGLAASNPLLGYYLDRATPDVTRVQDLEAELHEDPIQVMFGGAIADMEALGPSLEDALNGDARVVRTAYPASGVGLLDVVDPGVDKAAALAFLQRRYGVAPAATLAIGDNWNDRGMLEAAGLGLVMGNADPEMLALGFPALPTNDEDGVAVAIETHILADEKRG
jgi:hydroxymethylpyrimidine pyrophosphatase-like HAD family hydrolase